MPKELRSLYQYVENGDAGDDAFTQRIKELVDRANESTEVTNMITFAGDAAAKEKQLKEALAQAEAEKAQAEAEKAQAEAEKAQAEAEKAQAEAEKTQAEVRAEALERMNRLALLLAEKNRMGEYIKASADPVYQQQLFEEFGL